MSELIPESAPSRRPSTSANSLQNRGFDRERRSCDRVVNHLAFPARRRIIVRTPPHPLCVEPQRGFNMARRSKSRHIVARVAALVLFVAMLAARAVVATTFMSVEPIPGGD